MFVFQKYTANHLGELGEPLRHFTPETHVVFQKYTQRTTYLN